MPNRYSGEYRYQHSSNMPPPQEWIGHVTAIGFKDFLPYNGTQYVFIFTDIQKMPAIVLTCEMHDYEERGEVGQLCFELAENSTIERDMLSLLEVEGVSNATKLTFEAGNVISECGIRLRKITGGDITIVESVHPFFLAIYEDGKAIKGSSSVFPLSEYKESPIDL